MPFKKLFALAKKTKVAAVPRDVAVDIAVTVEQTESVFGPEEVLQQDLESQGHVHVRMIFDENGEMTSCKLEHLEVAKAAPAPLSNATTLVGSPMPSKPVSPTAVPEDVSQNEPADSSFFATIVARVDVPVTAASAKIVKIPASSPAPAQRLLKVEDFCVIRVLGEGGQGLVSLVQDKITGKLYALKAIKKHRLQTRDLPTVFVEQYILKTLAGRPFFTSLKGSFEDEDHFFLLMDYCPGGDLDERIRKEGKLPMDVARRYAAQIVLAMEDLRRHRIVHRDVKPKNILLTAEDEVIITDFGLARTFGRTIEQQPWRTRQIWQLMEDGTEDGALQTVSQRDKSVSGCGTFGYIAPEMFSAEYSYEVDVWSFAVTLYEMLHGKLPFGFDRTDGATTHELITRSIIVPVEIGSEVDADATDLLQSMLAKDPQKRPTWEQIKEHPWFDSIDWKQIANRQPSPAHEAPVHLQPEPHARYIKFGEPYPEGKAEYPFFHWIAPELFVKQTYASRLSSDGKHSTQKLLRSASWVPRTSATSYCSIALATLSVARSATPSTAANSAANSSSAMPFGAKTTTDVFDAIMSGTSGFDSDSFLAGFSPRRNPRSGTSHSTSRSHISRIGRDSMPLPSNAYSDDIYSKVSCYAIDTEVLASPGTGTCTGASWCSSPFLSTTSAPRLSRHPTPPSHSSVTSRTSSLWSSSGARGLISAADAHSRWHREIHPLVRSRQFKLLTRLQTWWMLRGVKQVRRVEGGRMDLLG